MWPQVVLTVLCLAVVEARRRVDVPAARSKGVHSRGWDIRQDTDVDVAGRCSMNITIALHIEPSAVAELKNRLRSVSDPRSHKYGAFLSMRTIASIIDSGGIEDRRADRVEAWINSAQTNVVNDCPIHAVRTRLGDMLRVSLSISQAEYLFNTTIKCFEHEGQFAYCASITDPSVPSYLSGDIDFVTGLQLPHVRSTTIKSTAKKRGSNIVRAGSNRERIPQEESTLAFRRSGRRNASTSNVSNGLLRINVVENRDRAFQVHLGLNISEARRIHDKICEGHDTETYDAPNMSMWTCPDGTPIIKGFHGVATPTRGVRNDYLDPVKLSAPFRERTCISGAAGYGVSEKEATGLLVCVVRFGPSLLLANYVPTVLLVRAELVDGTFTEEQHYGDFTFPTQMMTVSNVRKLYNVPKDYTSSAPYQNSQAVVNFLNISVSRNDTRLFQAVMAYPEQPPVRFRGEPNDPTRLNDIEGSIDIQWIQGIGQGVPTSYWLTAGGDYGHEPFLDWLIAVVNSDDPELVQSLSYGENEDAYTVAYEDRCNLGFIILGLRGVTVVVASGDTGIQGSAQMNGDPPRCLPFVPTFPASSPYVTVVGGTQFSNHMLPLCDLEEVYSVGTNAAMPFACPDDDIGEIVCSTDTGAMITSGGGVSNRFGRPWYQDTLVPSYLNESAVEIGKGVFNVSGRGYPDISAVGQNVPAAWQGKVQMAGGTSSSAPIVAGLFALMNGERLAARLPPLGFVNPLLYRIGESYPAALNDIVAGNVSGGNRLLPEYVTCEKGFRAKPGWDAATGLGSLNFAAILTHVVPSPRSGNSPFASDDDGSSDGVAFNFRTILLVAITALCSSLLTVLLSYALLSSYVRRQLRGASSSHSESPEGREYMRLDGEADAHSPARP